MTYTNYIVEQKVRGSVWEEVIGSVGSEIMGSSRVWDYGFCMVAGVGFSWDVYGSVKGRC